MITLKTIQLNPKQSRALAVLLALLAVAILAIILTAPVLWLHLRYDRAIEDFQDRLLRYQRVAVQQTELQKALDEVKGKNSKKFFLKSTSSNLAGIELQDLARAAVENHGGRLSTIQIAPVKEEERYWQLTVNITLFANASNLQRILHVMETQQPYMLIDNLLLRPGTNAAFYRGAKPAPGVEPEMMITMDVSAYAVAGK